MNALKQFYQWFMGLQKRERIAVGTGGIFLMLFIIYVGIVNPYYTHRRTLNAQITQLHTMLAWMRPAVNVIQATHGTRHGGLPGGSLLSAVNNSVTSAGLGNALQQAHQAADGSVRAQFSSADFDNLVRWLDKLHKEYGVVPVDMSVTHGSAPGQVDANIKLQEATQ